MPDPIEPALSEAEWVDAKDGFLALGNRDPDDFNSVFFSLDRRQDGAVVFANDSGDQAYEFAIPQAAIPRVIAFLNDALPDTEARKITREKIITIRRSVLDLHWLRPYLKTEAERVESLARSADLSATADALESYLPKDR